MCVMHHTRMPEMGEVNSNNKFSIAQRKLMFDDGGPLNLGPLATKSSKADMSTASSRSDQERRDRSHLRKLEQRYSLPPTTETGNRFSPTRRICGDLWRSKQVSAVHVVVGETSALVELLRFIPRSSREAPAATIESRNLGGLLGLLGFEPRSEPSNLLIQNAGKQ
ncbi:hypothetical protein SASPL_127017 [Salvia splendens]|uniref:Uncharacterized protein n=1 Tax=Salvia splendens TaxID=180675 RepID=A0A8X8ZRI3_SALSN|nr:hypothetical protein SASPL_127017 [Salvia splendens]